MQFLALLARPLHLGAAAVAPTVGGETPAVEVRARLSGPGVLRILREQRTRSPALAVEPRVFPLEGNRLAESGRLSEAQPGRVARHREAPVWEALALEAPVWEALALEAPVSEEPGAEALQPAVLPIAEVQAAHLPVASGRGAQPAEGDLTLPRAASSTGTTAPGRLP